MKKYVTINIKYKTIYEEKKFQVSALTIAQCFRKFFAMRPDEYKDIISFKII